MEVNFLFNLHQKVVMKLTDNNVKLVEDKLNNRPRKAFGYQTPNEVYFKDWCCRNYAKLHLLLEFTNLN